MAKTVNFGSGIQSQPAQPWQLDTQGLNRKQALMDALMAQNMTPTPIQTVSGRVINNGLLDGFTKIATAAMLKHGYEQNDRQRSEIQKQQLASQNAAFGEFAGSQANNPMDFLRNAQAVAAKHGVSIGELLSNPAVASQLKVMEDRAKGQKLGKGDQWVDGDGKIIAKGAPDLMSVGKGSTVLDPNNPGTPLFSAPEIDIVNGVAVDKSKLTPGSPAPQDYNKPIVLGEDGKPTSNVALQEFEKEKARLSGTKIDIKLTEDQRKQTSFGMRAQPAHDQINSLLEQGYKPNAKDWYTAGPAVTNWLSSPKGQQYMNAGKEFVAGVLRGDSGATITEQEWEFGKQQYIPLPGDNPAVVAQKNAARERVLEGFRVGAGPGAPHIPAPGSAKTPMPKQQPAPTNTGGWSYGGVQK